MKRGFTLIELLVVIAIIGILAALILAALGGVKAKSYSTSCLNNLKQLQLCYQMYADGNGDHLADNSVDSTEAGTNAWIQGNVQRFSTDYTNDVVKGVLFTYNQSLDIYRCAASHAYVHDTVGGHVPHNRSYSISVWLSNNNFPGPQRYGDVHEPSKVAVFLDENAVSIDNGAIGIHAPVSDNYWNLPSNRHNNGCNLSFIDGHAEHWSWTGEFLSDDNSKFSADDSQSERPDAEVNPTNLSRSSRNDPDAIRLASAVQTP